MIVGALERLSKYMSDHYIKTQQLVEDNWLQTKTNGYIAPKLFLTKKEEQENHYRDPRVQVTIEETLAYLEEWTDGQTILIQAASGMGKSMFLKEIAFRWAKCQIRQFDLVLLISLREPDFKTMQSALDLFKYFCEEKDANEIVTSLCGKNIAFLLDGYDEFKPEDSNLITKLLKHRLQELHRCTLIVSCRPHVAHNLQWDRKIEISGFTKESQEAFVEQELKDLEHTHILEGKRFLRHLLSTISHFCEVPFNLAVLVSLYKYSLYENSSIQLPKNLSDLHKQMICYSVRRHLKQCGKDVGGLFNFNNLPSPFDDYIEKLAEVCYHHTLSNNKQLCFSFEDIKKILNHGNLSKNDIYGFGLFKAVEKVGIGKDTAYEFVHLSVKEFLAAHYIDEHLPETQKFSTIKQMFFAECVHLFDMFALYMELTDGHHLRRFISATEQSRLSWLRCLCLFRCCKGDGEVKIDNCNDLMCTRIFRCFKQTAANMPEGNCAREEFFTLCRLIERKKFQKEIKFIGVTLSASDLELIAFLLTQSSNVDWEQLCLLDCCIQDRGFNILYQALKDPKLTIKLLILQKNNLTSAVDHSIHEIVVSCMVEQLWIGYNAIGDTEDFSTILSNPSSKLTLLEIKSNSLSSKAIIQIFHELQQYNPVDHKLTLDLFYNQITDETCGTIAPLMKENKSLEWLELSVSAKGAEIILNAFMLNTTLKHVTLPNYSEDHKKVISSLQEQINEYRKENDSNELEIEYDYSYEL